MKIVKFRRVDLLANDDDFTVALMGSLGFGTKFIMAQTGLTSSQVIYRLGRAAMRRLDYRNGQSKMSKMIMQSAVGNRPMPQIEQVVAKDLKAKGVWTQNPQARAADRRGVYTVRKAG